MSEPTNDFSGALAVGRELGLNLPDSRAVRDAYAQAQAESQPWLFNHVVRSWLYRDGNQLGIRIERAMSRQLGAVNISSASGSALRETC
jgi:hypothetical protein